MSSSPDPTATGRKRILFLVPAFREGLGGPERVISTLLRYLDHTRYECHLALVLGGPAFLENVPACVAVHRLRVSRMRYALPAIIRVVWKLRPQTLLSTVSYLNAMLVMARPFLPAGIRLLLREATTPSGFIQKDTAQPRLWRWLYRYFYPRADKIICLSDSIVGDMALHFDVPREKLVRIYNPVDVSALQQLAGAEPNPYHGNGPNLVAAGRLRKEKGFDLLLDALPVVAQRFPGVRLALLGEGPDENALRARAARLGIERHIDFLGFKQNPWPYFSNADLFVLPSRLEGMPNALLEALALGTLAVAADCPGAVREIKEATGALDLVAPEDSAALAAGIVSALCRRGEQTGSSQWAALERFDPGQIAAEYSALF
jgi:glycosyltransferase involved in cell wall biosynthesis